MLNQITKLLIRTDFVKYSVVHIKLYWQQKTEILSLTKKIFGGTYVQQLVDYERQKRELENKQNSIKK